MQNKDQNYKKIKEKLDELHFLTEKEAESILEKVEYLPQQGIAELAALLNEAKKKQNSALKKLIKKDPQFVPNLEKALRKMYRSTTFEVEKQTHKGAKEILKKLL